MAKVVLIVDSATGTMIDAAGRGREGARYKKLAKRMLSLGTPTTGLDYGGNGATKLDISRGGAAGEEINLRAEKVNISTSDPSTPAVLMINGNTLDEIIATGGQGDSILEKITGKEGEVSVDFVQDPERPTDPNARVLQIGLDQEIEEDAQYFHDTAGTLISRRMELRMLRRVSPRRPLRRSGTRRWASTCRASFCTSSGRV